MHRPLLWPGATLCLCAAIWWGSPLPRWWRAADFLHSLSKAHAPGVTRAAPAAEVGTQEEWTFAGASGSIRARLYRPSGVPRASLVVAHGVHYHGIDERRLVHFCRELARKGVQVVTPELTDLTQYRISPQGVSIIADAVSALGARADLPQTRRVGLIGFSFAGGLALVAAAHPQVQSRLSFVVSVGGHHDLERVLDFFLHDRIVTPAGPRALRAHDYGLVILILANLRRFVPEDDIVVMHNALLAWLHEDRPRALAWASQSESYQSELLWTSLEKQKLAAFAPALEAIVREQRHELLQLSPRGRLRQLRVPVYLLHGSADSVIPPSETEWAALELRDRPHRALVSPLLEHVEVNRQAGFGDSWALVRFMTHLL